MLAAHTLLATAGLELFRPGGVSVSINDLHSAYSTIFPTNNRNAASHLWSSWIIQKSSTVSKESFHTLFTGFCPVSGSPVQPSEYNTYRYSLPGVLPGSPPTVGTLHHCCAPCVCDTRDMIHADVKTVQLANGAHQFSFAVIGDPCKHASVLARPFTDPFSGSETSLSATAPEVQCGPDGKLVGATYSDNGAIIIGLLGEAPPLGPAPDTPTQGRVTTVGGLSFHDSREFDSMCQERAQSGYSSGMGLIFRQVAQITSLDAPARAVTPRVPAMLEEQRQIAALLQVEEGPSTAPASSTTSSSCDALLPAARREEIARLIASEQVLLLGMRHARCTDAAAARLEAAGACFRWEAWDEADDPLWSYMKCLHPAEVVNGMMMHSYVYLGGKYLGNGFALSEAQMRPARLTARLQAAGARLECSRDCDSLAPAEERAKLAQMLRQPLVMLGWAGCPCTNIARSRFESVGACYLQQVWPTDTAPLYKHLQCKYGEHHHSFVFFGGVFSGDGFSLESQRMAQPAFEAKVSAAGASLQCQRQGDKNLLAAPLQPCTQSNDGSTTGWARTGSCNWDPSDSGYHEVCVTMSDEFLKASAQHDANDLSSVVQAGGHWCICAWAFAAAVKRDPSKREGITLECDRTNAKLREVYEMHIQSGSDLTSPSGAAYKAKAALDAVDQLCPAPAAAASTSSAVVAAAAPAAAAAATTSSASTAAAASLRASSRPISDSDGRARSGGLSFLVVCAMAVAVAILALRHSRATLARYLSSAGFYGGTRLPSTDYQAKDLGCYDSGGEAEPADRERLRVRETPAMRDAV